VGALERGTRFLLASQGRDGLWRDFHTPAGQASEWPTGYIASALLAAGGAPRALERAAAALIARQNEDGGWGYNERTPSDADSTACVLLFLADAGQRGSSCDRGAACLCRHQRLPGGGVATYAQAGQIRRFMGVGRWMRFRGWCSPHTEVTATAGCALARLERETAGTRAAAAWRHVRSRQRGDGSWTSYWWTAPHYATLRAVELALAIGDRGCVARAVEWTRRTQASDGGWSAPGEHTSAFATALCLSLLVAAGADGDAVQRAAGRLVALQLEDGGWPSRPHMRIPMPSDADPDRWRPIRLGSGAIVADQHRTFTSAACVAALAGVRQAAS
jgi:squalene cyclase